MGLLDVLNGMQNGPRGPSDTAKTGDSGSSGGMSPMTMAILGLLAFKAFKHLTGGQPTAAPAGHAPAPAPKSLPDATAARDGGSDGGLGDLLSGGLGGLMKGPLGGALGGLLAGGAAGSVLSGGLGDLVKQLQDKGHSEAANSWVGNGPNKQISSDDLASALGADQINALVSQTGLSRNELLEGLAQQLPDVVHHLTPDGRLPTEHEAARWL
jgi:uncharacterized protein YidB (DUF937 family)